MTGPALPSILYGSSIVEVPSRERQLNHSFAVLEAVTRSMSTIAIFANNRIVSELPTRTKPLAPRTLRVR